MNKRIFAGTLQRLFVCVIVICILGIILLGTYSCAVVSKTIFQQIEKTALLQMQTASEKMEALVACIENMVDDIESNKDCFLGSENNEVTKVETMLAKVLYDNSIGACFLCTSDGREYTYNPDRIYVDTIQLKMQYGHNPDAIRRLRWYNGDDEDYVYRYANYYIVRANISESDDAYTTLFFFVRKEAVDNIMKGMQNNNNLTLIMNEGKVIAVNNHEKFKEGSAITFDMLVLLYETETGIFNFQKYSDRYITAHYQMPGSPFKFLAIYKTYEFYKEGYGIIIAMLIFVLIFIILILWVYSLMRKRFIKPMQKLMHHMDGNLTEGEFTISGGKEIEMLVSRYNKMRSEISKSVEALKVQEEQKRQAEVDALRYQIKPHFLYNTLSNIKILAMTNGQSEISEAISRLTKMYRYLLSGKTNYVKISEEIDFIENYIAIMSSRYDNGLNTFFLVDDDVKDYKLPNFLLQPVVENAIIHGLAKKLNKRMECLLRIKIKRENNILAIEVFDSGEGISEEKISEILSMCKTNERKFGVGLYNTIARLKHRYGEEYQLDIDSEEGQFTKITIKIPLEIEEE